MAPEVWSTQGYDGKVDLWSTGCVFYEMLSGNPPYLAATIQDLLRKIERGFEIPEDMTVSQESKDILKSLIEKNPERRITLLDLAERCAIFKRYGMVPSV